MQDFFKSTFKGDKTLWVVIVGLIIISTVGMFSAISQVAFKGSNMLAPFIGHIKHLGFGLIVMIFVQNFSYKTIRTWIYAPYFLFAVVLLIITPFWGDKINGAIRGITILGIHFHTIEIAKLALILFLSDMLSRNQHFSNNYPRNSFLIIVGIVLFFCAFIAAQNLSTAVMLFIISIFMMLIARVDYKKIGLLITGIVAVILLALALAEFAPQVAPDRFVTWKNRIVYFLTEESAKDSIIVITDENRQIMNSKIAIANGKDACGPGNSVQRDILPLAFSDFIFAILVEEWGMFAVILTIFLYILIFQRAGAIANKCDKAYPAILVIGLSLAIVLQAFISMGVTVALGPVTGQPLPLISRGGTSIILTFVYLGIILSVSQYANGLEPEHETITNEQQSTEKETNDSISKEITKS